MHPFSYTNPGHSSSSSTDQGSAPHFTPNPAYTNMYANGPSGCAKTQFHSMCGGPPMHTFANVGYCGGFGMGNPQVSASFYLFFPMFRV